MSSTVTQQAKEALAESRNDLAEAALSTSGIVVDLRSERSLLTQLLHAVIKPFKPAIAKSRHIRDAGSPRLTPPKKAKSRCHVKERNVEGLWIYELTAKKEAVRQPKDATSKQARRIFYFAGGGWQMPPSNDHWLLVSEFVCRLPNTKLTLISPPLAPSNPASVSFPQIGRLYNTLMAETAELGERIIVAGDSAGGNISLCLVAWSLADREHGGSGRNIRPPVAIMAICPTTDLRHEAPEIKNVEKFDPLLTEPFIQSTARAWSAATKADPEAADTTGLMTPNPHKKDHLDHDDFRLNWGPDDPRVSPIRADLAPLAKNQVRVHGLTASYDILGPEAVIFREKCKGAGIRGEWLDWQGQMHCFPLAFSYGLRESKAAVDWVVDVLSRT